MASADVFKDVHAKEIKVSRNLTVAETNATPLTMANTVRIMRNLRASTPRKVRRMTGEDTVTTRVSSCGRALARLLAR